MGNAFSSIPRIALVDINGHVYDVIELSDGSTLLYLSGYAMHYLRQIYKKIRIDKDYVDIPMEDFDFSKAFLKYTAVNDDMVGFVNRVDNFVMKDVRNFTSISECLDRFTSVIWDKADVNIFPIEMLLRGYLASENSYDIPVITDPREPVRLGGLGEIISDAALSTKLSFEGLNALFESPKPTLKSIGSGKGYYDPLYAFAKCLTDDELAALRK
jgi:hypothetical protein